MGEAKVVLFKENEGWDGACASAHLLRIAADLVRDDTPFHREILYLCFNAVGSLRTRKEHKKEYAADTDMPEHMFRMVLRRVLDWDDDMVDAACDEVRRDAAKKNSLPVPEEGTCSTT